MSAPRGAGPISPPGRLVVGCDGSAEAQAALDRAAELAAGRGEEVDVYSVATPPVSLPGALGYAPAGPDEPFTPLEEAADRVTDEVSVHAHLQIGPAAPRLAAATAGDLLVVGTQTRKALGEALTGSVTDALVTAPSGPLVAVPLRSRPSSRRRPHPDVGRSRGAKDGAA